MPLYRKLALRTRAGTGFIGSPCSSCWCSLGGCCSVDRSRPLASPRRPRTAAATAPTSRIPTSTSRVDRWRPFRPARSSARRPRRAGPTCALRHAHAQQGGPRPGPAMAVRLRPAAEVHPRSPGPRRSARPTASRRSPAASPSISTARRRSSARRRLWGRGWACSARDPGGEREALRGRRAPGRPDADDADVRRPGHHAPGDGAREDGQPPRHRGRSGHGQAQHVRLAAVEDGRPNTPWRRRRCSCCPTNMQEARMLSVSAATSSSSAFRPPTRSRLVRIPQGKPIAYTAELEKVAAVKDFKREQVVALEKTSSPPPSPPRRNDPVLPREDSAMLPRRSDCRPVAPAQPPTRSSSTARQGGARRARRAGGQAAHAVPVAGTPAARRKKSSTASSNEAGPIPGEGNPGAPLRQDDADRERRQAAVATLISVAFIAYGKLKQLEKENLIDELLGAQGEGEGGKRSRSC